MKRSWVVCAVLVLAWTVLGLFCAAGHSFDWLPKWALAASVLAPLAWIGLWTVQGLRGPGKWWQTDVGVNMVWLELSVICTNGMVAWAVWFHGGLLDTPATAWAYVGGLLAGAVIISWRSVIWARSYRSEYPLQARLRELTERHAELQEEVDGLRAWKEAHQPKPRRKATTPRPSARQVPESR